MDVSSDKAAWALVLHLVCLIGKKYCCYLHDITRTEQIVKQ